LGVAWAGGWRGGASRRPVPSQNPPPAARRPAAACPRTAARVSMPTTCGRRLLKLIGVRDAMGGLGVRPVRHPTWHAPKQLAPHPDGAAAVTYCSSMSKDCSTAVATGVSGASTREERNAGAWEWLGSEAGAAPHTWHAPRQPAPHLIPPPPSYTVHPCPRNTEPPPPPACAASARGRNGGC
jgi:hypothetical protein